VTKLNESRPALCRHLWAGFFRKRTLFLFIAGALATAALAEETRGKTLEQTSGG